MTVLILHALSLDVLHFSTAHGCGSQQRLALGISWLSFTSPAEGETLLSSSPSHGNVNHGNLNHDDIFFSLYQKAKKFFIKEYFEAIETPCPLCRDRSVKVWRALAAEERCF